MDKKSSRQTPTFSDNDEERLKPIDAQSKAVKFSKPENIFEKLRNGRNAWNTNQQGANVEVCH